MNAIRVANESAQHNVNRHIAEEMDRIKSAMGDPNSSARDSFCAIPQS
jgi:hypothetical protein